VSPERLSEDTIRFLLELLERQQVAVGAPDFEALAQRIVSVLAELRSALE
jgi:hypothetical protein